MIAKILLISTAYLCSQDYIVEAKHTQHKAGHKHKTHVKDSQLTQLSSHFVDGEEEMGNDIDVSAYMGKANNEDSADLSKKSEASKAKSTKKEDKKSLEPKVMSSPTVTPIKESNIVVESLTDQSEEETDKN